MTATHPLIVGGELPSDKGSLASDDDTGPERYFIDHAYHFTQADRAAIARRSRSSASMSSISIDSLDEAAWAAAWSTSEAARRFDMQEAGNGGGSRSNRLRSIKEQRPASLTSVDFDKLNYHESDKNGYVSFSPTANTRSFSPKLGHGSNYPSTDSLMYSQSDRSGTSTLLATPIATPDTAVTMVSAENSLSAPPSLRKTNRIPPRWRSDHKSLQTKIGGPSPSKKQDQRTVKETGIPRVISLDSDDDEEDDIEAKDTSPGVWNSSKPDLNTSNTKNVFTQKEKDSLLKFFVDDLMFMTCAFLDSVDCSLSLDTEDDCAEKSQKAYVRRCRASMRDDSFATKPSLITF